MNVLQEPESFPALSKGKEKFPWRIISLEILAIAIGISLGFSLERWNENRRERIAETKILEEMRNGLVLDSADIQGNAGGHQFGIQAVHYFRRAILGKPYDPDSVLIHQNILFRSFIAIQNTSAYEALKAKGLETIKNDSLRFKIISLYDFDYQILFKLEETYPEMQFLPLYFNEFTTIISPFYEFNEHGKLKKLRAINVSGVERARLLTILQRIDMNRQYTKKQYQEVLNRVLTLKKEIEQELAG